MDVPFILHLHTHPPPPGPNTALSSIVPSRDTVDLASPVPTTAGTNTPKTNRPQLCQILGKTSLPWMGGAVTATPSTPASRPHPPVAAPRPPQKQPHRRWAPRSQSLRGDQRSPGATGGRRWGRCQQRLEWGGSAPFGGRPRSANHPGLPLDPARGVEPQRARVRGIHRDFKKVKIRNRLW